MHRISIVVGMAAWVWISAAFAQPQLPVDGKNPHIGFPVLPPIADADPADRHEVSFRLPRRITAVRTGDRISISVDPDSLEEVKLSVGRKMVLGLKDELLVSAADRPEVAVGSGLQGWSEENTLRQLSSMQIRNAEIAGPEDRQTVAVRLTLFETDIPAQHHWMPETGKYKVLWTSTLRATVGPAKLGSLPGRWTVEFANGVIEVCEFGDNGSAEVVEPARSSAGAVERVDGAFRVTYADDRVERWTPIGRKMIVEHWFPGSEFPTGRPVLGIAELHRE